MRVKIRHETTVFIQTQVATSHYPDVGMIFLVSTRYCPRAIEIGQMETRETRVFKLAGFDPESKGKSVYSAGLAHPEEAPVQHENIVTMLEEGALPLKEV